jgi:hypothetical protein
VAAVPLQHPAPNAELSLATDASDTHIGGVLQQKSKDHWQPLGFSPRKLTDTESRYSTFDCKLLAADTVDFEEMAAEQNRCPETQGLLGGTSLKLAFRQTGISRLAGDISTGTFHPIVPLKFQKDIFAHFHNVAHPGRLASCRIISSRCVLRGLSSDVTAWARRCLACQRGKIHRHTRLAPQPIPISQ